MKKLSNAMPQRARRPKTTSLASRSPMTVLHIDDDPNDTELFQAAARRAGVDFLVQHVTDGEQAMAYLTGRGVYVDRRRYPLPALVLLDLKMPRATGFDVLRWIRNHPEVGNVPVVIFSGSELQDDVRQAYAGGADSYLVKPIGFGALVELVKKINQSWLGGRLTRSNCLAAASGAAAEAWRSASGWTDPAGEGKALP
jgi:CheY-like chemotaxis protein